MAVHEFGEHHLSWGSLWGTERMVVTWLVDSGTSRILSLWWFPVPLCPGHPFSTQTMQGSLDKVIPRDEWSSGEVDKIVFVYHEIAMNLESLCVRLGIFLRLTGLPHTSDTAGKTALWQYEIRSYKCTWLRLPLSPQNAPKWHQLYNLLENLEVLFWRVKTILFSTILVYWFMYQLNPNK